MLYLNSNIHVFFEIYSHDISFIVNVVLNRLNSSKSDAKMRENVFIQCI